MKILSNIKTSEYQELVTEQSFLCFKWVSVYRKFDNVVFKYNKKKDTYNELGFFESDNIIRYFRIPKQNKHHGR